MSRRWRQILLAILLGVPVRAFAHAHLVRSEPAADASVVRSPEWIRLWFSEVPEPSMTRIVVIDSAGTVIAVGCAEPQHADRLGIEISVLQSLSPGRYTVAWTTAGPDGHPSRGRFTFAVAPSAGTQHVARVRTDSSEPNVIAGVPRTRQPVMTTDSLDAVDVTSPWFVAVRAIEFAALLATIGVVVFRLAVVSRLAAIDDAENVWLMSARAARLGTIAALTLLATVALRAALQSRMMNAMGTNGSLRAMSATHWGHALLLQAVAAVIVLAGFALARRRVRGGWAIAGVAAAALGASPSIGGHAAAAARLATLGITIDGLHVLGAAGWLGSLLCVLAVGMPITLRAEQRWHSIAALIDAFSPIALSCAALTALTGFASAWLRLGSIGALPGTTYGRVLIVKLLVLSALVATGAYNWRRVKPSLGTAQATGRLRTLGTAELAIGCVIIVVTAVLVALPTPVSGL